MTTEVIAVTPPAHSLMPPRPLGETYGFWCQTFVLLAAAILAYFAIRSARAVERRKAAAAVILASAHDIELTMSLRSIATLHKGDKNMATYAKTESIDSEISKSIRYALNHYEYVSVGIARGVYDELVFKHSLYSTVTRLYERTKPYIDEVRRIDSETNFQEFECLACRWLNKPLKKKKIKTISK